MSEAIAANRTILVVGGGISGLTAAIEAAEAGADVLLVERNPYLGGRVAQLNKYFPKLCPPSCGLEINFRRIKANPRVKVFTMTEVSGISGDEGNFQVTLKTSPRYVNERCTACGKCAEVCEASIANPFNFGMDRMKAAYLPHDMAFPLRYVVDPSVLGTPDQKRIVDSCAYGAVDFDMQARSVTLTVGSIVWATGWDPYDAGNLHAYGFGEFPNVITNMMIERLAAVGGPTKGRIVRPSDGKEPKNVAIIHCAGSRDEFHLPFCSRICCMAALKEAQFVREQYPDSKVTLYYIDIRALDTLEDFYVKVKSDPNVTFIKSKVATIHQDGATGDLILQGENTTARERYLNRHDLVVLATGMNPTTSREKVPVEVETDQYGFVAADSGRPGIHAAGCTRGPLDVAAAVQQSTAAALKALQSISRR